VPSHDPFAGFRIDPLDVSRDLDGYIAVDRASFMNPTPRESIEWEAHNSDVVRSYVLRAPDGAIVGFCASWLVFDELHINSLAVRPEWRRRGLARFLLAEVIARTTREGAERATLEVRESNVPARRLYEGFGFTQVAVRRRYYTNPLEDALVLWMDLRPDRPAR
jgi:ribosomal-protein-alanine N-acetyltransferase